MQLRAIIVDAAHIGAHLVKPLHSSFRLNCRQRSSVIPKSETPHDHEGCFYARRVTSHRPENPHFAEHDIPVTEVIAVAAPAPVFVDSTGRRSRLLRRLAYAFGVLVMLYGGMICVSLAGGPVSSSAVLPLPGLEARDNDDRSPARPGPLPDAGGSRAPRSLFVTDALPRHPAPAAHGSGPRLESTRIPSKSGAARPTATKTSTPTPSATRPMESTSTPTTPATTSPTSTPQSQPPVAPNATPKAAPVTPRTGTGGTAAASGGQGAGAGITGASGGTTAPDASGGTKAAGASGNASPSGSSGNSTALKFAGSSPSASPNASSVSDPSSSADSTPTAAPSPAPEVLA